MPDSTSVVRSGPKESDESFTDTPTPNAGQRGSRLNKGTLKALRDRRHPYRDSLEFALSRRIEVWEKHEIARLTPGQLQSNFNILILKLASTNRETQEQLKFFRDSGGNIVQHFPPEDEPEQHKTLKARIPNLDMLAEDETRGEYLVKTSLANLVRICEPAVILDEGHKATSGLARKTIEGSTLLLSWSSPPLLQRMRTS